MKNKNTDKLYVRKFSNDGAVMLKEISSQTAEMIKSGMVCSLGFINDEASFLSIADIY